MQKTGGVFTRCPQSRPVREALMEADIVIVIMLLQFGSMGQITHTQKIGHSYLLRSQKYQFRFGHM